MRFDFKIVKKKKKNGKVQKFTEEKYLCPITLKVTLYIFIFYIIMVWLNFVFLFPTAFAGLLTTHQLALFVRCADYRRQLVNHNEYSVFRITDMLHANRTCVDVLLFIYLYWYI